MRKFKASIFVCACIVSFQLANASTDTIGTNGINSVGLTVAGQALNGAGISIGEVDLNRAAKKNDPDTSPSIYNDFVDPFMVFDRIQPVGDGDLGPSGPGFSHGETVASVMISTDITDPDGSGPRTAPTDVANGARLLSAASDPNSVNDDIQGELAAISQTIISYAKSHPVDLAPLRAINMSIGVPLPGNNPSYNGNSTLTEYVDWSAKTDDILYVVSGNEFDINNNPLVGVPADNFNGMTIASTKKDANGIYSVVSDANDYNVNVPNDRNLISLVAPGDNVDLDTVGSSGRATGSGTSFAAPMVTATVALLQQFGEQRHMAGSSKFASTDFENHLVMKAVLMNSADKLIDR